MNHLFLCPFAQCIQEHYIETFGIVNYVSHLRKCIQVAIHIQTNPNEFHLCPSCLQVYVTLQEAESHRQACPKGKVFLIKDDSKWVIKLGASARKDLETLEKAYNTDSYQNKERLTPVPMVPFYQSRLPYQRHQPFLQPKLNNWAEFKQPEDKTPKDRLSFQICERDTSLFILRCKYYNKFTRASITITHFQHKIPQDNFFFMLQNSFKVDITKEIFIASKVLEFVEDVEGDIEEEIQDTIYFSIFKEKYGQTSIWVLVNESNEFFKPLIEEHPWALFKLASNTQNIIEIPAQNKPMVKKKNQELIDKLDGKKLKYKELVLLDQQLSARQSYEVGLTTTLMRRIKDQLKSNAKQQAYSMMYDNMTKDMQQIIQVKYDDQIKSITLNLRSYLDDKKKEQRKEFDEMMRMCLQKHTNLTPLYEQLQEEEEILKQKEAEVKKRYQLLEDEEEQKGKQQRKSQKNVVQVDQAICVECKVNPRNTIIKPCYHCVLCENCFTKLSHNLVQCPLKNSKRCARNNLIKQCHTINFIN